jgi:hypothetical protein
MTRTALVIIVFSAVAGAVVSALGIDTTQALKLFISDILRATFMLAIVVLGATACAGTLFFFVWCMFTSARDGLKAAVAWRSKS